VLFVLHCGCYFRLQLLLHAIITCLISIKDESSHGFWALHENLLASGLVPDAAADAVHTHHHINSASLILLW